MFQVKKQKNLTFYILFIYTILLIWQSQKVEDFADDEAKEQSQRPLDHMESNIEFLRGKTKLFSLERSRERYYLIFTWQISQGYEFGVNLIFDTGNEGRLCKVESIDPSLPREDQEIMEISIRVMGAKLFNLLPRELRDFNGDINEFIKSLDSFLKSIPDNPQCPYRRCRSNKNSLLKLLQ